MPNNNSLYYLDNKKQIQRSVFDLSYSKLFDCDMGQLIPVMHDEVVPGDVFNISNEIVVRTQPLVAPILHEINCFVHYFFVPYRILWDSWEDFITGGEDGDDATAIVTVEPETDAGTSIGSLWDYFGFPTGLSPSGVTLEPIMLPFSAYNLIWNEFYRDENLQDEVIIDNSFDVLYRNWEKDYFMTVAPWQQRGTAPAFPITGTVNVEYPTSTFVVGTTAVDVEMSGSTDPRFYVNNATGAVNMENALETGSIDGSNFASFDIHDIRLGFQIQSWLEANARAGARYTEFLQQHFGVSPRDERLDRPEYIGGTRQSVVISEVLQTSESGTTPQGTMAGHGLSAQSGKVCNYRVNEYGIIMGLLSIMPRPSYAQGVNRQWFKETKYDFYSPEFAGLSEQVVYKGEIYYTGTATDDDVLGYQGAWDHMRTKQDMYCGNFRSNLDYWHLGRQFGSLPSLNEYFTKCNPRKDAFVSPSDPAFYVHHQNNIKAFRPLPIMGIPDTIV